MRLFLALDLPHDVREAIGRARRELEPRLPGWRFTRAEGVHVTVRFLGEVEDARLAELGPRWERAALAATGPISLEVAGLGCFPSPRRPRVLWVGVAEDPDRGRLRALAAAVEREARAAGFAPEERGFRPHATLARAAGAGASGPPEREWFFGRAWIESLTLFRSDLGPGGARYTALATFPLGGAAA
ncbi:MAG TPA: RNA 2',3'-cyclic phosphodiesterase [Candidatus Polarisedimenticolaceae bacterium]